MLLMHFLFGVFLFLFFGGLMEFAIFSRIYRSLIRCLEHPTRIFGHFGTKMVVLALFCCLGQPLMVAWSFLFAEREGGRRR